MDTGPGLLMADIPIQPTSLLGRVTEIDEVVALLGRDDVRLVTLSGPGGIGKTRIAVAVAERLRDPYSGAVRMVFLATIRDSSLVVSRLAQALQVREQSGVSTRDQVAAALGSGRWLVILDNFEQVRAAATDVAWLLARCAGLKVLVTSRVRLQVRGEHEYAVPPLAVPAANDAQPGAVDRIAAVQLFVQRAQDVVPNLILTDTTGPIVADICRRLDGLPLAIELAAARIKVLPPAAMLARLDRRLPLLTSRLQDAPDRHRTMRDAVAWSYDLLAPAEQRLFRRLCVFAGGFTLHEAASVAFDAEEYPESEDGASFEAIEGLATLVDSSLLRQQELEGEPYFTMLETLREFGLEELVRTDELAVARDRHADFFLGLADAAMLRLRGAERSSWLSRLERAHDNLRAAIAWLCESADTSRAVRLGGALWQFWWWRSHLAEGRQQLERMLALPGAAEQGPHYARVLTGCGALADTQGDYTAAEHYHAEAVAAWQALDDTRGLALTLIFRWLVAFNVGDPAQMTAFAEESLRLFRELEDPWGVAMSLMEQGVMAMFYGDHAGGERVLAEAIAGFQAIHDPWGIAISQGVLGNIKTDQGDFVAAEATLAESLTALLRLDDQWGLATIMMASVRAASMQGRFAQAVLLSGAVQRMHEIMGAPLNLAYRERHERNLAAAREHLGPDRFDQLLAEGAALTAAEAVAAALAPVTEPSESPTTAVPETPAAASGLDALLSSLSPREREVMRLVPARNAKEIGEELFISESTVRTHMEHILNKLGLRNQKELVAFIYEHRLV